MSNPIISVVIPCYRVRSFIGDVIAGIPPYVTHIIVVDDGCPEKTGIFVRDTVTDSRVVVVERLQNGGVGAAVKEGYRHALDLNSDIIVKMDGDGQMCPLDLPALIAPLLQGRADYTKGNRFSRLENLGAMPFKRLIGNSLLSFLSKFSSGYWHLMDPTNGYTAIHQTALKNVPFDAVANDYFFESHMLCHLHDMGALIEDVPMIARYGNEKSNLHITKIIGPFLRGHLKAAGRRLFKDYFIRDFNLGSLGLLLGVPMVMFGLIFGVKTWMTSLLGSIIATSGTVMLGALPILLGMQFLVLFFQTDMISKNTIPLQKKYQDFKNVEKTLR